MAQNKKGVLANNPTALKVVWLSQATPFQLAEYQAATRKAYSRHPERQNAKSTNFGTMIR